MNHREAIPGLSLVNFIETYVLYTTNQEENLQKVKGGKHSC